MSVMGTERRRRVRALFGLTSIVTAVGALAMTSHVAAQTTPTVTFTLSGIPATMVNAHWQLETGIGTGGLDWIQLEQGNVPAAAGSLSIAIPLNTALQTVNDHFMIVLFQPIDANTAYLGNALLGVVHSDLVDGATFYLTPVVNQVPVYSSEADADAASSCPSCTVPDNPGYVWAQGSNGPPPAVTSQAPQPASSSPLTTSNNADLYTPAQPKEMLDNGDVPLPVVCTGPGGAYCSGPLGPVVGTLTGPGSGGIPNVPSTCPLTGGCDSTTVVSSRPVGDCQDSDFMTGIAQDCVTDAQDFSAEAFRGWSNKVPGDTDFYHQHSQYKQTWDNGYRTQAGPFQTDNSTSRTSTNSSDIVWEKRGDCWNPPAPGDDAASLCTGFGWDSNWGRDAWRWEKHTYNDGGRLTRYELVFETTFNGGNDVSYQDDKTGDVVRPGIIQNDAYGPDWTRWAPDTSKETQLGTAATISNGAVMDIAFNNSFGGGNADGGQTFSSSETDTTYANQSNAFTFRGPASGTPWMGHFFSYDGNHRTWQWEYWTCQFNSDYIGAMDETELYQTDTACWDASQ